MILKINKVYIDVNKIWAMSELDEDYKHVFGFVNGCKLSCIKNLSQQDDSLPIFKEEYNRVLNTWLKEEKNSL